jgi:hypothetical protein
LSKADKLAIKISRLSLISRLEIYGQFKVGETPTAESQTRNITWAQAITKDMLFN